MSRAVSSVLGVLLLAALAVALAGAVGLVATDATPEPGPPLPVELSASLDVRDDGARLLLLHGSGPTLDVGEIRVVIAVDGSPLPDQPPVPFYSAAGYASFPSGPFNAAADPRWELGERAGLVLTGDNLATVAAGGTVTVEIYRREHRVARTEVVVA